MADYAHELTDRELTALERRIKETYKSAADSVAKRAGEYLEEIKPEAEKLIKAMTDAVDDKTYNAAKREYQAFLRDKTVMDKRFSDLQSKLASELTKFNQTTATQIAERMNGVFSLNHNFAAYTLEHDLGLNLQFTLYDERTVERLLRDQPKLLPKPKIDVALDKKWNQQKISSEVAQAILSGDSIPKIAERFQNVVGMNETSAVRNARTAITSAENAGRIESYHYAESIGITLQKEWLATLDDRTRDEHRALDGQRVGVDEPFEVGGEKIMFPGDPDAEGYLTYNCFVADTKIASDSEVVRSYVHEYSGDLISVETSLGVNFTCTPNHPILTRRGWIKAGFINYSDSLAIADIGNEFERCGKCDIQDIHSSLKATHCSPYEKGLVHRVPSNSVNFHGDIPASDVEVITQEWLLRKRWNASGVESIDKLLLKYSDESFAGKSAFVKCFVGIRNAALRIVRLLSESASFLWRCLSHPQIHGFRPVARSYSGAIQNVVDNLPAESKFGGKALCGLSGNVLFDNIVGIKVFSAECHVYNLQTHNGYYFVNSSISQNNGMCNGKYAIAHNCRCTLVSAVEGVKDLDPVYRRDNISGELIDNMSYKEWEAARRGEG